MKMFAKLFGPPDDQVLAVRDTNDDGAPEIRVTFNPASPILGLCSVAVGFDDTIAGGVAADLAFSKLTEEQARALIAGARITADNLDAAADAFGIGQKRDYAGHAAGSTPNDGGNNG